MRRNNLPTSAGIIPLAASLCFTILTGCGDDVTEVTNVTNEITGMERATSFGDLPECSAENFGLIYFVADSAKVFYCDEKKWTTLNGANGADGKDGEDGEDGVDGEDGKDGVDGRDGISGIYDSLANYTMDEIDTNESKIVIVNYGHSIEEIGECTDKRNGEVTKKDSSYFVCDRETWRTATPYEYDTYQWADSTDGAQRKGNVTGALYIYDYNRWRAAAGVEKEFGACVKANELDVKKFKETYFICKQRIWNTATTVEYDTHGKKCMQDAAIESGVIHPYNKYVCDDGKFRFALPLEILADLGCTSYNDGAHWKIQHSNYFCNKKSNIVGVTIHGDAESDTLYDRDTSGWSFDFNHLNTGTMVDPRDGKTYKTIGIKSQVWMAENLRYVSATSKCHYEYYEDTTYCIEHGRLYKWSDARQICPEGWHLPDTTDWQILLMAIDRNNTRLLEGDPYCDPYCNVYGFSALGSYYGDRNDYFSYTYAPDGETKIDSTRETSISYGRGGFYYGSPKGFYYWTSTPGEPSISSMGDITWQTSMAYAVELGNYDLFISYMDRDYSLFPVRCVKDSE